MPNVIMPPPPVTPTLAGVSDLNTLVQAILERPKDVGEFMKEYRKVISEYDEMTRKYGALKKIETLQQQTEAENVKAKEALDFAEASIESAKTEAKSITDAARAGLAKRTSDLDIRKTGLDDREARLAEDIRNFDTSRGATEKSLAKQQKALDDAKAKVAEDQKRLDDHLAEFESFTSRMRA